MRMNTEAPALAIEWPWSQALELGGYERWATVLNELTGQMALLCHLPVDAQTENELIGNINLLRKVALEHLYG